MTQYPTETGTKTRGLLLEALFDLPLGASIRELAERVGRAPMTVTHHLGKLQRTGQVQVVQRGYHKRRLVVPVRLRVSETEREWLKLGMVTARAVLVVARAEGRAVTSSEVARILGWSQAVARYHLQRARTAGVLEARHGAGYTLPCSCDVERDRARLHPRTLMAVQHLVEQGRPHSIMELARALSWTRTCAKYHLTRAHKAGLLLVDHEGNFRPSPGSKLINWTKTTA